MRVARRVRTAVATGAVGALLVTASATAAPAVLSTTTATTTTTAAARDGAAQVVIDSIDPAVLTPGGTLSVRGRVRVTGTQPLDDVEVRLRLQRSRLDTREQVAQWASADPEDGDGNQVAGLDLELAPGDGGEVPFAFEIPASDLGLPSARSRWGRSWGPRGIAVEVVGDSGQGLEQLGLTRSFMVWLPGKEFLPTQLSVLVPFVAPPTAGPNGLVDVTTMQELTRDGGRLEQLLRATAGAPVDWALDPALLASAAAVAEPLEPGTPRTEPPVIGPTTTGPTTTGPAPTSPEPTGPEPTPTASSSPATPTEQADENSAEETGTEVPDRPVAVWLEDLRAAAGERDVVALPYADADVVALTTAGEDELLDWTVDLGRATVETLLGEPASSDVAWPANGSADPGVLGDLSRHGYRAAVLDSRARPVQEPIFFTPTGRADLDTANASMDGLLSDYRLSEVLADTGDSDGGAPATARFLAETAAVTLEQPGRPRHLLVTAPREWQPDADALAGLLADVELAPWVEYRALSELRDTEPPGLERGVERAPFLDDARPEGSEDRDATDQRDGTTGPGSTDRDADLDVPGPLPASYLHAVSDALDSVRSFASVLTEPQEVVAPLKRSAAALTSVAWRPHQQGRRQAAAELSAQVQELESSVRVLEGSSVNVLTARAELPVTVVNDLGQEVNAVVRLQPLSSRLVVPDTAEVNLGAGQREQVRLPFRALANGDVEVEGTLLTPDGDQIGPTVLMQVRVRADWESRGTAVAAVAMALLVLAGLVRTIRRGRRRPDDGSSGSVSPESPGSPVGGT